MKACIAKSWTDHKMIYSIHVYDGEYVDKCLDKVKSKTEFIEDLFDKDKDIKRIEIEFDNIYLDE